MRFWRGCKRRAHGHRTEGHTFKNRVIAGRQNGRGISRGQSGYPVLPIALTGTEDRGIISNLKRFRRSKIKAVAGELFYIEIPKGQGREEAMRNATDEIMCQIAAKLPESYRGFYKNYPRVRELEQK
ncbi:MAG: hypothetical protein IPJ46_04300 [Anaerolineales bacterium]|nr:hypothetical protein [Anaerolineales bacterium]